MEEGGREEWWRDVDGDELAKREGIESMGRLRGMTARFEGDFLSDASRDPETCLCD